MPGILDPEPAEETAGGEAAESEVAGDDAIVGEFSDFEEWGDETADEDPASNTEALVLVQAASTSNTDVSNRRSDNAMSAKDGKSEESLILDAHTEK